MGIKIFFPELESEFSELKKRGIFEIIEIQINLFLTTGPNVGKRGGLNFEAFLIFFETYKFMYLNKYMVIAC